MPYFKIKEELSIDKSCVLRGNRVIIPRVLQREVLEELHETHPGIVKMKRFARSYVWWRSLDFDRKSIVRECTSCQQERQKPLKSDLRPWAFPEGVWQRLHIDYAEPTCGRYILVLIDSYSKWIEAIPVAHPNSLCTIEALGNIFATHVLPVSVVSDNASCFSSYEFKFFLKANGIKQILVSAYHPSSNGMAERAVKTVEEGIRKLKEGTINSKLMRFLSRYRITPHETTQRSPAELLLRRQPRTRLDQLRPRIEQDVMSAQDRQVRNYNKHCHTRIFEEGQSASVVNFGRGERWLEGIITKKRGPLTYEVELKDGRVLKRHIDHIIYRQSADNKNDNICPPEKQFTSEKMERPIVIKRDLQQQREEQQRADGSFMDTMEKAMEDSSQNEHIGAVEDEKDLTKETSHNRQILRRSTRVKNKPDYFHF